MSLVKTEVRGHIIVITLDRPEARNAFNIAMAMELEQALDLLDDDPSLRAGVLRSEGSAFCAGQDLKELASLNKFAVATHRGGFGIMRKPPAKPLIAAIEGQALAGGLELALCCDMIVASQDSVFGLPEVTRSLIALGGGCFRLPLRLPYQIAMEMVLTGSPRSAQEMHQHGLVNRIANPGQVLEEALRLAASVAAHAPLAVKASKEIMFRSVMEGWTDQEAWERQRPMSQPVLNSLDHNEGLKAFKEKRPPNWIGA